MSTELDRIADEFVGVTSWAPVALDAILAGEQVDPEPSMLVRSDGRALIYAGKVHGLQGEPESGKSWIVQYLAAERLERGEVVAYFDFEDSPSSVVGRLLALGVDPDAIRERFRYVRPDEPLSDHGRRDLDAAAAGATVAVVDGTTEALTLHGLDLGSNVDIAKWLELLPRRLARRGAAVITLDHVVKDKEARGRYAIGAQHKLAGVDCAYSARVIEPFGRGRVGRVGLMVTKDRPGHVRGFADDAHVAEVRFSSEADGSVSISIEPPPGGEGKGFRPTFLMERVSTALEEEPGLTAGELRKKVKGRRNEHKDRAVEVLVAEGFVERRQEGRATRHYVVRSFREDASDAVSVASSNGSGPALAERAEEVAAKHADLFHDAARAPVCSCSPPGGDPGGECWKCSRIVGGEA